MVYTAFMRFPLAFVFLMVLSNVSKQIPSSFTGMVATGGVVSGGTIDGDYKDHVFNSSSDGPFVVTTAGDTPEVEYLVIAGGGGGGGSISGGGGGAGGYLTATGFSVTTSSYPITVGAGGAARCAGGRLGGLRLGLRCGRRGAVRF